MNPLEQAIREYNLNQLRLLLDLGYDVNEKTEDGDSLLLLAIEEDHDVEIIKMLLAYGADINAPNKYRDTPLHEAAYRNAKEVVEVLIANGAKVNAKNRRGKIPLSNIFEMECFHELLSPEKFSYLLITCREELAEERYYGSFKEKTLLEYVFDRIFGTKFEIIEKLSKIFSESEIKPVLAPLLFKFDWQYYRQFMELIASTGYDINIRNDQGVTPLSAAIRTRKTEIAAFLIELGSDVNAKDEQGRHSLFYAVTSNLPDIADLLIDNGAEIDGKDLYGNAALLVAVKMGRANIVKCLLDKGADANIINKEDLRALHEAAARNSSEILEMLLDKGATVDVQNIDGRTPLSFASTANADEMVSMLLKVGADPALGDTVGRTPLMYCALGNATKAAKILLSFGADAETTDAYGGSAIWAAAKQENLELVKLIASHSDKQPETNSAGESPFQRAQNRNYGLLHQSIDNRDTKKIKELLEKPLDINEADFWGRTFLHYAMMTNDPEVIQILLRHGADPSALTDEEMREKLEGHNPNGTK